MVAMTNSTGLKVAAMKELGSIIGLPYNHNKKLHSQVRRHTYTYTYPLLHRYNTSTVFHLQIIKSFEFLVHHPAWTEGSTQYMVNVHESCS